MHLRRNPKILGLCHIKIGANFSAGDNLWLEAVDRYAGRLYSPVITIGNNVSLSDSVHIAATHAVIIGNDVLIGSRVLITDHNHGLYKGEAQSSPLEPPAKRILTDHCCTNIGDRVWIGDGVAILAGSVVGDGSIIAANSVVVSNIPPHCIAAGSPAKPIRKYNFERNEWNSI